jgi:hypothetical protein
MRTRESRPHLQRHFPEVQLVRGETLRGHIGLFGMDPHYRQQVDAALGQLLARPA